MKINTLKSVLAFTISPIFFSAPIYISFTTLFFGYYKKQGGFDIKEFILTTIAGSLVGFFFYVIPATIVGVIYIKNLHLSNFKQELICFLSGFIICFLWIGPFSYMGYKSTSKEYMLALSMGVTGAITAFIVARLLNYLKNKESVKKQEYRGGE